VREDFCGVRPKKDYEKIRGEIAESLRRKTIKKPVKRNRDKIVKRPKEGRGKTWKKL
jgi:hypothetical protein